MGHIGRGLDKSRRRLYLSTRRRSRRQISKRIFKTYMTNDVFSGSSKNWPRDKVIGNIKSTYTEDAITSICGTDIDFKTEIVTENRLVDIGGIKIEPSSNNWFEANEAINDIYYQIETEHAEIKSEDIHHEIDIKEENVAESNEAGKNPFLRDGDHVDTQTIVLPNNNLRVIFVNTQNVNKNI